MQEDNELEYLQEAAQNCVDGMNTIKNNAEIDLQKECYEGSRFRYALENLRNIPAKARVVIESQREPFNLFTLFICPNTPPTGNAKRDKNKAKPHELTGIHYASYESPLGRLASIPPGQVYDDFYVHSVEILDPRRRGASFDSINTRFQSDEFCGTRTIPSLLEFLNDQRNNEKNGFWDNEIIDSPKVLHGILRTKKTTFALKHIILSFEQDNVCRSATDDSIILLGAPGTGKTTTLLQRLRNKLFFIEDIKKGSTENYDEDEIERYKYAINNGMSTEWALFTPAKLLKQYLMRALDKNELSNLTSQMWTWSDYRHIIANNKLGILVNHGNSSGLRFIPESEVTTSSSLTTKKARDNFKEWCDSFSAFRDSLLINQVKNVADVLSKASSANIATFAKKLLGIVTDNKSKDTLSRVFSEIHDKMGEITLYKKDKSSLLDSEIEAIFIAFCNKEVENEIRNIGTIFWETLRRTASQNESTLPEEDEENGIDDIYENTNVAAGLIKNGIKKYCPYIAKGEVFEYKKDPVAWVFAHYIDKTAAEKVVKIILQRASCSRLLGLFQRYTTNIHRHYQNFRKNSITSKEGFYSFQNVNAHKKEIQGDELDMVIYVYLSSLRRLNSKPNIRSRYGNTLNEKFKLLCKSMIYIDEATDFSPIELACMRMLAHPLFPSVFVCGDINQRLTRTGARTEEELLWAISCSEKSIHHFTKTYRQTRRLYEFGQEILKIDGASENGSAYDDQIIDSSVLPALGQNLSNIEQHAEWVASRIVEIIKQYTAGATDNDNAIPTIAIFVPNASYVEEFAEQLGAMDAIKDESLLIEACVDVRQIGDDWKICVYPIDFIKGLEFEAVFFVGIDQIQENNERSILRILYIGSTRASMFLGLTCTGDLPKELTPLNSYFCLDWSNS